MKALLSFAATAALALASVQRAAEATDPQVVMGEDNDDHVDLGNKAVVDDQLPRELRVALGKRLTVDVGKGS